MYKLLQRLPLENRVAEVGEIIKIDDYDLYYDFSDMECIKKEIVENNPELFEEIKEVGVEINLTWACDKGIHISFSKCVNRDDVYKITRITHLKKAFLYSKFLVKNVTYTLV